MVCGEPHFKTDVGNYSNLFITTRNYNDIQLIDIPKANKVTQEKKKYADNLMKKHYGEEWRNIRTLKFYIHVVDGSEDSEVSIDTLYCQPQEEEQNDFI